MNPDGHQTTVRNKETLKIGPWNVRKMYQNGKYENVKQEMEKPQVNILGISEAHWKGSGKIVKEELTTIYSGGETNEGSVAIFLDKYTAKFIFIYWYLSSRVAIVILRGKPFDIAIIQVHARTADKSGESKSALLNGLPSKNN